MIKAWHFLQDDRRLRWGTKEVVEVGQTYSCDGAIALCENGMHGSERIIDALKYAPGAMCCRVEICGEIVSEQDKLVGRNRKVLSMCDITNVLHEFACVCAEHAMKRYGDGDARSFAAIEAKRRWLKGEIADEEMDAAGAAAGAAAWAAGAAAGAAAWAAAGAAAWAAATRDAAGAAAWAAATRDAARDAARDAQNRLLSIMVLRAMEL